MRTHLAALLVITATIILYTFHWFYPTAQLIITPDFGHSDAWHLSFPTKWELSTALKNGHLPLWSSLTNTGFPLLGEGETGIFFLPNLLLYSVFPPVTAYMVSIALTLLTAAWGCFYWLRLLRLPQIPSTLLALTFAFSGLTMTHLQHITLLQSFTLMPLILALTHELATKKSAAWIVLLALSFSQQLLAGFPQAVFITGIFAGLYYLFLICKQPNRLLALTLFMVTALLALALSAIQLFPSYEFLGQTSNPKGFSATGATQFSFPPKHIATFFDPFALGNPKLGTYPPFTKPPHVGSIFWENSGFIGMVPIVFVVLLPFLKHKKKKALVLFLFGIVGMSLLLMAGKHSPLYFIFSIWPFTLFRVPSRFIWMFTLALIILAATAIHILWKKGRVARICIPLLLILNLVHLISAYSSYQALGNATDWLSAPEATTQVAPRIYTIGAGLLYNTVFYQGWQDTKPYHDLRNLVDPNQNVYWNISHADVYAGRFLYRSTLFQNLLTDELQMEETIATPSAAATRLLTLSGVGSVVSAIPLDQFTWNEATLSAGASTLYVYTNPTASTRAYIADDVVTGKSLEDAKLALTGDTFDPTRSVLLEAESIATGDKGQGRTGEVKIIKDEAMEVVIEVKNNPTDAYLVLADTYYPGWMATIDGKPVDILPANIMHRAVSLLPGDHVVRFTYTPASFQTGRIISAISHLLCLGLVVFHVLARVSRKPR